MIFSQTYSCEKCAFWEQKETIPFNELILSWNGTRPKTKWVFWVGIGDEWFPYAEWGSDGQRTFKKEGIGAKSYQDVVVPKVICRGFKVKVEGDDLEGLDRLIVCVSNLDNQRFEHIGKWEPVFLKNVPRQSQKVLAHPRCRDLCSPTSTTTAMRTLTGKYFDPIEFAKWIRDMEFDIYGNWILNIAEAYNQTKIPCQVKRLDGFDELHQELIAGRPVIVSVKGELKGAPHDYPSGHLMCVVGYEKGLVYCIDSAFPDNESTWVAYELDDFLKAWSVRRYLAYIFR